MSSATPQNPKTPSADTRSWGVHLRATLMLGLPLIAAQLGNMAIHVTDTVMVGWLGAEELAASVLGTQLFFVAFMFGNGFAHAVMPLAATAEGEGDIRGVRRSVRMGFWMVIVFSALLMPFLWHAEAFFLMLGQEPSVARLASDYVQVAQWAMFPALGIMVLRSYLSALERAGIVMWATLLGVLLNVLLNYMFIFGNFGAPALGIVGAAIASLGTTMLTFVSLIAYAHWAPGLQKYTLFVRVWRADWQAFSELFRLGWPISTTLLAEVGLFAASSIMMGWIGTIELAAHGIALQVISVVFMLPLGLSSAGTVRVGRAFGRREPGELDRAAKVVYILSLGIAVLAAVLFWFMPEPLIGAFLDEANPDALAIARVGVPLLAVAALFQIVDILQVVSAGLLRGLKDTRMPMLIAVASYWAVGMPAAYVLAFPLGFGGLGIWGGLALGLLGAAVFLTARFLMRVRLGLMPADL